MLVETQPELEALLRELSASGFVKLGGLLNQDQAVAVGLEVRRWFEEPSVSWDHYGKWAASGRYRACLFAGPKRDTALFDLVGKSRLVDEVIETVLSSAVVRHLLLSALGSGYRIWYSQARSANPGARPLHMHQDRPAEMTLSILLSDAPSMAGTTAFLPGSHRWPRVLESSRLLSPHYIKNRLVGATGVPGDAYLFYNATWHGRLRSEGAARTAIFLSFLARDAFETSRIPPNELLDRLGPSLRRAWSSQGADPALPPVTEDLRRILSSSPSLPALSPWRIALAASFAWQALHRAARGIKEMVTRG